MAAYGSHGGLLAPLPGVLLKKTNDQCERAPPAWPDARRRATPISSVRARTIVGLVREGDAARRPEVGGEDCVEHGGGRWARDV